MHMADALITPIVGGTMWAASTGVTAYSISKLKSNLDEQKIPLMGVMGAFIFAAQMINFTIPGTGSSGHIGGGLLLAILLGPYAGFLTMASILTIQALFFADGGLLSLGCNMINLGFYTCFIAYPFIYKPLIKKNHSRVRLFISSLFATIIGLQLGSFSVVMETFLSGKTELPFSSFLLLMQPIHLAIGIVEGIIIASVVDFVWRMRPEIIENTVNNKPLGVLSLKKVLIVLSIITLMTGTILSWFASSNPDGLEWSMFKASGTESMKAEGKIYETLNTIQENTAFLPDYSMKSAQEESASENAPVATSTLSANSQTSIAGLVGGSLTLLFALIIGFGLKWIKKKNAVNLVTIRR